MSKISKYHYSIVIGYACLGAVLVMLLNTGCIGLYYSHEAPPDTLIAKQHIDGMKTPLAMFKLEIGRYPNTDEGILALASCPKTVPNPDKWCGPYISDDYISDDYIKDDPWENPYLYESDGTRYRFWSMGPDKINGTEDDIVSEEPN